MVKTSVEIRRDAYPAGILANACSGERRNESSTETNTDANMPAFNRKSIAITAIQAKKTLFTCLVGGFILVTSDTHPVTFHVFMN